MKWHLVFLFTVMICGFIGSLSSTSMAQPVIDNTIPEPMPMATFSEAETVNFLIFGTATSNIHNPGMTDMVMLISVNREAGSASMMSIPRDLWVYAPGVDDDKAMMKLTSVYYYGEVSGMEGGGLTLLKDTIRYNLGIDVDYYAHVNFDGFLRIVDQLGGIRIAVDCVIQDWRLKSPELDKHVADNYEMVTLPIGIHWMDSDTALWYVRSRRTSTDIDRGRRQQDVMRALWRRIRSQDLLSQLPSLWDQAIKYVDTDLTLGDTLGFVPFALNIDADRIQPIVFKVGEHIKLALSPAPEYRSILVPERENLITLMQDFVTPPTENELTRGHMTVSIVNASGIDELEYLAADRLAQEGFATVVIEENTHYRQYSSIYDYTGQEKGSPLPTLKRVLRVTDEGVVIEPMAERETDFKVYVGSQYAYWSCTRPVIQPRMVYQGGEWQPEEVIDP